MNQERVLLSRYDGVSLWKWMLPPGASPLVEYGNSHRFVLVDRIPSVGKDSDQKRIVKSLGKGIIGSSSEEDTRSIEPWEEKCGYVYRSNGGKAIGFVNESLEGDADFNVSDTSNDIILLIVKVTQKILDTFRKERMEKEMKAESNDDVDRNKEDLIWEKTMPPWVPKTLEILDKYLDEDGNNGKQIIEGALQPQETSSSTTNNGMEMSSEDVNLIRSLMDIG